MFGPVMMIQLKGLCLPCLESTQEKAVRQAIQSLNNLPIRYSDPSKQNALSNVGGLVSGLFGGGGSGGKKKGASGDSSGGVVKGVLTVVDTIRGPSLCCEPMSDLELTLGNDDDDDDNEDDPNVGNNDSNENKTIPLRRISTAIAASDSFLSKGSCGIIFQGKDENDELLRIDIRVALDSDMDAESDKRDAILDEIFILLEWNKQRCQNGDTSAEVDDEEIRNKSAGEKLKHFAKREIEMQKLRKDREKRKEKYMKDSGGLKYTAIAMANREIS